MQACKEILLELSFQNLPVRRTSLSIITCLGIPNLAVTALLSAMEVEVRMKLAFVASLTLTIRISSYSPEIGSLGMNPMVATSNSIDGIGMDWGSPNSTCRLGSDFPEIL